jgi:septal ring factor EnvC (AmiA/AmiB activator)
MPVVSEVQAQVAESRRERDQVVRRIAFAEDRLKRLEQREPERRSGDERRVQERRRWSGR